MHGNVPNISNLTEEALNELCFSALTSVTNKSNFSSCIPVLFFLSFRSLLVGLNHILTVDLEKKQHPNVRIRKL